MAVATASRRKKQALPEGIDQLTLFTSLTPVSPAIPPARRRQPHKHKVEGIQQLDIFSLISDAFEPEQLDPDPPAPAVKPQSRRKSHAQSGQAHQLSLESLAETSAEDVPAVHRGAPLTGGIGESGGELRGEASRAGSGEEDTVPDGRGDGERGGAARRTGGGRTGAIDVDALYSEFPMIRSDTEPLPEGSLFSNVPEISKTD